MNGDGAVVQEWLDFVQPQVLDAHREVRNVARNFAQRRLRSVAERMDREDYFPRDVFQEAGELGLVGIALPEEFGGGGLDILAAGIVREELARVSPAFAASVVASSMYFGYNLSIHGTESQKKRYLPAIASGQKIGAWALTEPEAGSDARSIRTQATSKGGQFCIRGRKCFITNAPVADLLIVIARAEPSNERRFRSVIVEREMRGVSFGPPIDKLGFRGSPTGDVVFDDVMLDREQLVGGQDEVRFEEAVGCLELERSLIVFSGLGIARACLENAIDYARSRHQFGRQLAEFQLVKQRLASIASTVAILRSYGYTLVGGLQAGVDSRLAAAIGKYFVGESVLRAATDAMQVFGGAGYTRDFPIERIWRDARLLSIGGGTSEIQTLVIANQLLALDDYKI